MAVSKVAPPHISSENRSGTRRASELAQASLSCERTRVALSD
jgi:hypothetical protein